VHDLDAFLIFRREQGEWKLAHRHANHILSIRRRPMTHRRSKRYERHPVCSLSPYPEQGDIRATSDQNVADTSVTSGPDSPWQQQTKVDSSPTRPRGRLRKESP
jgi:hypothetical protein